MTEYHFRVGHYDDVCDLITTHHYSRRMAGNVQLVAGMYESGGLFGDYGKCVAGLTVSIPPTKWSEPVLELSRLVRLPDAEIRLSSFISQLCKHAKQIGIELVVSFADATHDHHGGIYQACSWKYAGFREPTMDGILMDGQFIPGRSCNSLWGTRSPEKLSNLPRLKDRQIEPHFDCGKYLYYKTICRAGRRKARRIGLGDIEYPKPNHKRNGKMAGCARPMEGMS